MQNSKTSTYGAFTPNLEPILSANQARTALERNWEDYFWTHQDLLVFSYENQTATTPDEEYTSLHARALSVLRYMRQPGAPAWAHHFFAYDHLTLVHRDALLEIGGWDTHIPFYATDCDLYNRLTWAGYWQGEAEVGLILDVSSVLDDIGALFRLPGAHASFEGDPGDESETRYAARERRKSVERAGETWEHLVAVGRRMEADKLTEDGVYRNTWQGKQTGGRGEPFYRDPEGFDTGVHMLVDTGRRLYAEKWGHRGCEINTAVRHDDAWRLERDWDPEKDGDGLEGGAW